MTAKENFIYCILLNSNLILWNCLNPGKFCLCYISSSQCCGADDCLKTDLTGLLSVKSQLGMFTRCGIHILIRDHVGLM